MARSFEVEIVDCREGRKAKAESNAGFAHKNGRVSTQIQVAVEARGCASERRPEAIKKPSRKREGSKVLLDPPACGVNRPFSMEISRRDRPFPGARALPAPRSTRSRSAGLRGAAGKSARRFLRNSHSCRPQCVPGHHRSLKSVCADGPGHAARSSGLSQKMPGRQNRDGSGFLPEGSRAFPCFPFRISSFHASSLFENTPAACRS